MYNSDVDARERRRRFERLRCLRCLRWFRWFRWFRCSRCSGRSGHSRWSGQLGGSRCTGSLGCLSARAREGGREGRTHARAIARDHRPVKRLATRTGARVRPDVCPSDGVTRYKPRYNGRTDAQKVNPDKGFWRSGVFPSKKPQNWRIGRLSSSVPFSMERICT